MNLNLQTFKSFIIKKDFWKSHQVISNILIYSIIVCWFIYSCFIYPGRNPDEALLGSRQRDGQYELFTHVERTIRENLQMVIMNSQTPQPGTESLIAGALAMALCYIHRYIYIF